MRYLLAKRRWIIVSLTFAAIAVPAAARADAADRARHPNILFLIADEFRADCLGVAGHPIVKTPHLDALARGGARFTNAYSASPVCSPDRAVLFTGRYPHVNGVVTNNQAFRKGEVALPALLRHYGYVTAMAGKLHLEDDDSWWDVAWKSTGGGKPWFLFLSTLKPHSEFVIPERYATMYKPSDVPLPPTFDRQAQQPPPVTWQFGRKRA